MPCGVSALRAFAKDVAPTVSRITSQVSPGCGEVLARVVDHPLRSQVPNEIEIGAARHPRDLGAEMPCQLDRKHPHPAGGAEDEDPLAGFELREIPQEDERGERAERHRGRLLEPQGAGDRGDGPVLRHREILRMRAVPGEAEDRVTGLPACHTRADLRDDPGEIRAEDLALRREEPGHQPSGQPQTRPETPRPACANRPC